VEFVYKRRGHAHGSRDKLGVVGDAVMKNTFQKSILGLGFSLIFFMSCAEMDLSDFQLNDYVEYRMFNLLDDYPSLYEAVNSLDQTTFNRLLGDAVNFKENEFITMQEDTINLLSTTTDSDGVYNPDTGEGYHEASPVPRMLRHARTLVGRINQQDAIDNDTLNNSYAASFFDLLDTFRQANVGYEPDVLAIMQKGAEYTLEREYAEPGYMLKNTNEAITNATDPDHRIAAQHNQEVMGKQLIQANSSITVDGDGKLIPAGGGTPIGLANSAKGVGALLKGVIELLQNKGVRDSLYDVIRELGTMSAAKLPTTVASYNADEINYDEKKYATDGYKRVKDVMREEIENTEDFFTEGGAVYSGANDLYRRRTATEYCDSELRNVKKESLPPMIALLLRGDRPGASFSNKIDKDYFLEHFLSNFGKLDIDWDNAHLEESIYDLLRYDTYGRDRLSTSVDPVTGQYAYSASILEALMVTGGVTTNMGWTDADEETGETSTMPSKEHGHGQATGYITLNDSIFSIETHNTKILGIELPLGMYELGFNNEGSLFRSKDPFTGADAAAGKCAFSYNQNYSALNFLATHSVGDVGSPTGGNPQGTSSGLNLFVPYNPSGFKDNNTAAFNMNTVVRGCWNGEGPYYYADPSASPTEINGKIYYRYLRPNGKTYAYVYKDPTDPADSAKWEYIYPAEGNEPKDDRLEYMGNMVNTHASCNSKDLKDGVTNATGYELRIRIKIGNFDNAIVKFPNRPFNDYSRDEIRIAINQALAAVTGKNDYCRNFDYDGKQCLQILAEGQSITISNDNTPSYIFGNYSPVDFFYIDGFDPDEVRTYPVDCFQISAPASVNIQIDDLDPITVDFSVESDGDGNWSPTEAVQHIQQAITDQTDVNGEDYVHIVDNRTILVNNNSNQEGVAQIKITSDSTEAMTKFFGFNSTEILQNTVQRYSRYRPTWHTDYYMIRYTPLFGSVKNVTPNDTSGNASGGGCMWINEIIPEKESKRACASQEEAIFRNLQWVLTEKKIILIVPFYLEALGVDKAGMFQIIEGNGFEGLVNCRKFRGNHVWAKGGSTTDSTIPGDYRLRVIMRPGLIITESKVWDESLGKGTTNPPCIPHTFASISRLAFPRSEVAVKENAAGKYLNFSVGSRDFVVGDDTWKKRNGLVPVIIAALATAWEMSDENHKGILRVLDSQFAALKPLFFFNHNNADDDPMRRSWIPRIAGSSNLWDFMKADCSITGFKDVTNNSDGTAWFGGWAARNFYQSKPMPTSMTFMIDSDPSLDRSGTARRMDGLLPMLTAYNPNAERGGGNLPNTRIVTKLIKFLSKLGDPAFGDVAAVDDNDLSTYGTRRKIAYGAEQFMTTQRMIKTGTTVNVTTIDETSFKNLDHPSWMFTAGVDGDGDGVYDDIRPEDVVVDEGLDISIGSDSLGMGLAVYPDERDPTHPGYKDKSWEFFNDAADKAIEFTSNLGPGAGKFNVTENLISLIEKVVTKVSPTQNQIDGLVHTLGIINTEYREDLGGAKWVYPTDLVDIQTRFMPTIMDLNKINALASAEFNYTLMSEGSLIEYVLNTMETPYRTSEIFSDLYGLLSHKLIAGYEDSYNSILWTDLVEMQEGLIESIRNRVPSVEFTESNDFQYNGPYGESIFSTWDPFGDLGQVFSH